MIFCIFIFRWSLEGVYHFATLKITKWHLLTWSQLCLSPSRFKRSPTLLTLSQWGRRSLNTRVDEAWLTAKREIWTAAQQLTFQVVPLLAGSCQINECELTLFLCFHSSECMDHERREKNSPAREGIAKSPLALLAFSHPTRLLGTKGKTQWLVICQNGWWSTLIVSSWPVFNSIWLWPSPSRPSWFCYIPATLNCSTVHSGCCPALVMSKMSKCYHTVWRTAFHSDMGSLSAIFWLCPGGYRDCPFTAVESTDNTLNPNMLLWLLLKCV